MNAPPRVVRYAEPVPYETAWRQMQEFTLVRQPDTVDEIWCLQHPPVYTLGLNADRRHVLAPGDIPVVQTDRGGQVTYHGPGQVIVYPLLDVKRAGLGPRPLVNLLQDAAIAALARYDVAATTHTGAPGVYVDDAKIASVGLRIRRGGSYHGLALNVDMDLTPFAGIDPCGIPGQRVTQLADLHGSVPLSAVAELLLAELLRRLPR